MVLDFNFQPPQDDLLRALVDRHRSVEPDRDRFDVRKAEADSPMLWHNDEDLNLSFYVGDVAILEEAGLLAGVDRTGKDRIRFDLAPKAFIYYDQLNAAQSEPRQPKRDVDLLQDAVHGVLAVRTAIDSVEITDPEREILATLLHQLLTDVEEDLNASAQSEEIWRDARPRMSDRVTILKNARDALDKLTRTAPVAWKIGTLISQINAGFDLLKLVV